MSERRIVIKTNTAAQVLQRWIARGALNSQHETYINERIRQGDSWYARTLAEQGKDAAEAELAEWCRESCMSNFAESVVVVAQGMAALAQIGTKGDYTSVVDVTENSIFPRGYGIYGPSQMVVVFNRQAPGCGCNAPTGSGDWAPYGRLGLKAVTLQAGRTYKGNNAAQLGLVLPQRDLDADNMKKDGFTVATIDLEGRINGHRYSPQIYRDGYLRYSLGLIGLEEVVCTSRSSGGHFDDAVGFPGATKYLANALPKLGEYFTDLAARLTDHDHKH
jgi:hypothetical protein